MAADDEFSALQAAIKVFLDAQAYFTGPARIVTVTEDEKDISAKIAQAVGKAGGLCLLIYAPSGKVKHPDAFGIHFDPCTVVCRALENPVVNRSANGIGENCRKVAIAAGKLLNGQTLAGTGGPMVVMAVMPGDDPTYASYDCFLQVSLPLASAAPTRG